MEQQTVEREDLYDFQASPGEHIPSNRDPTLLPDEAPPDEEVRSAVKALCNGRTDGASMMRAEHLKAWLRRAEEEEEEAEREGTEGLEGAGDTWRLLVRLVKHIWDTGEIPSQMLLTIIVLIPKGNSGDFRGIGLLEVVWKVIEKIIDARLKCVPLHDALHGFRPGRGCSTTIMEVKLAAQLGCLKQCPFWSLTSRAGSDGRRRRWRRRVSKDLRGRATPGACWCVVWLIEHIWDTGEIPPQMLLTIIVLIPKGNYGDFRGIGLLEVVWKVTEKTLTHALSAPPCTTRCTASGRGAAAKPELWRSSLRRSLAA